MTAFLLQRPIQVTLGRRMTLTVLGDLSDPNGLFSIAEDELFTDSHLGGETNLLSSFSLILTRLL